MSFFRNLYWMFQSIVSPVPNEPVRTLAPLISNPSQSKLEPLAEQVLRAAVAKAKREMIASRTRGHMIFTLTFTVDSDTFMQRLGDRNKPIAETHEIYPVIEALASNYGIYDVTLLPEGYLKAGGPFESVPRVHRLYATAKFDRRTSK